MVKVLVVDDEKPMVEGIVKNLENGDYQVDGTTDGETALQKVREGYDVIITDLVMPGVSGMDLLRETKRNSPKSAVIMITGFATVESAVDAMKHGARDYITKPFEPNALKKVIADVVEELDFEEKKKKGAKDYPLEAGEVDKVIKALSNPIRRRSIEYLKEVKESSFTDIWKTLKVDDPTKLSFHLRVLKQANLIDQDDNKIYFLSDNGKRAIDLIEKF